MIHVRLAHAIDAREMAAIMTEIIAIGGTTAITGAIDSNYFLKRMETEREYSAWHVAETSQGQIVGFQWITRADYLPAEAAEIATFAKPGQQGIGIGTKLFDATKLAAKRLGYRWINANIRADNSSGLAYYQSRGFENYGKVKGYQMADGTMVDKILKRFDLQC